MVDEVHTESRPAPRSTRSVTHNAASEEQAILNWRGIQQATSARVDFRSAATIHISQVSDATGEVVGTWSVELSQPVAVCDIGALRPILDALPWGDVSTIVNPRAAARITRQFATEAAYIMPFSSPELMEQTVAFLSWANRYESVGLFGEDVQLTTSTPLCLAKTIGGPTPTYFGCTAPVDAAAGLTVLAPFGDARCEVPGGGVFHSIFALSDPTRPGCCNSAP